MWVARPFEIVLSFLWPITSENLPDQEVRQNKQTAHWKHAINTAVYQQLLLLPLLSSEREPGSASAEEIGIFVVIIYQQFVVRARRLLSRKKHLHRMGFACAETWKIKFPVGFLQCCSMAGDRARLCSVRTGMTALVSLHAGEKSMAQLDPAPCHAPGLAKAWP